MAQSEIDDRRREMTRVLRAQSYLPVSELCKRFNISEATARRDLIALSKDKVIVRTFGGAMADYDRRFSPFADRLKVAAAAKHKIAEMGAALVAPGSTIFIDAGTTLYALAERLRARPIKGVRVVTNSLAVGELLADVPGLVVDLLGGRFLANQSVLLGGETCRAAGFYAFDLALMGAEGFDSAGVWNSTDDVVALQQTVLSRARRHAVCVDASKMRHRAPSFLADWDHVQSIITDAQETADVVPHRTRVYRTTPGG